MVNRLNDQTWGKERETNKGFGCVNVSLQMSSFRCAHLNCKKWTESFSWWCV